MVPDTFSELFVHLDPELPLSRKLKACGLARGVVDSARRLARVWSKIGIIAITERRMPNGRPISITHLTTITSPPPDRRQHWLEVVFRKGLAVAELRERRKGERKTRVRRPNPKRVAVRAAKRLIEVRDDFETLKELPADDRMKELVELAKQVAGVMSVAAGTEELVAV